MRLPPDVIIPMEKLTAYLLVAREWDDKSKFLARAGFTRDNPHLLLAAIRELAATAEAVEDGRNEYGVFLRAVGSLTGPNRRVLAVVTIWLQTHEEGRIRFVTLKPLEGEEAMSLPLYERVALKRNLPEHGLRRRDVAVLIDHVAHPEGGEPGCVLEVFNAVGGSIAVVAVPESDIEGLRADQVLAVRPMAKAG